MTADEAKQALANAKELAAAGDFPGALKLLSHCAGYGERDAAFCNKLAKAAAKLSGKCGLRPLKTALLSSSTTVFLEPLLKYFLLCRGVDADVRPCDFGAWRGDILDESSWISEYKPDAALIVLNWRDAAIGSVCAEADAERVAGEIASLWRTLSGRLKSAAIFQTGFDMPKFDAGGFLAHASEASQTQTLRKINSLLLSKAAAAGVVFIDAALLQARAGLCAWEDARIWLRAKQHPSLEALPMLASGLARAVSAKFLPPKKVCVLDLDNTLWGGVISEDGLDGIRLGSPDPVGEAFEAFQGYLRGLKDRGVLLAVCSKNDEPDALLPFEKHRASRLKRDDFAGFKANWERKPANIKALASELNLGLDSFVFVDDNPAEIAEVSSVLPQVECLLLPQDPADFIEAVDSRGFFDAVSLSADDLSRTRSYAENAMRESAKASAGSLDDYLESLQMECVIEGVEGANISRAEQLLGKTNQFNATARRHSAEVIKEFAGSPRAFAKTFRLSDKFGDFGIVGVVLASEIGGALEIDSFAVSCRAMGRGFENLMLARTVAAAKEMGLSRVRGVYVPTPKNSQMADFFARNGFAEAGARGGARLFEIAAGDFRPAASHIIISERQPGADF